MDYQKQLGFHYGNKEALVKSMEGLLVKYSVIENPSKKALKRISDIKSIIKQAKE